MCCSICDSSSVYCLGRKGAQLGEHGEELGIRVEGGEQVLVALPWARSRFAGGKSYFGGDVGAPLISLGQQEIA